MMLKLIAIGVLTMLALSSVMNPKAFRALLAALAVGVIGIVANLGYQGKLADTPGTWMELLTQSSALSGELPSDTNQAIARVTDIARDSQFGPEDLAVSEDPEIGTTDQAELSAPRTRLHLFRVPTDSNRAEIQTLALAELNRFLKHHPGLGMGVERLAYPDLVRKFPELRPVRQPNNPKLAYVKSGKLHLAWVFDEDCMDLVRRRGREVTIKHRLQTLCVASVTTISLLCIALAVLKTLNARRQAAHPQDYLALTELSLM